MARLLSGLAPVTETTVDGGPATTKRPLRLPELQRTATPGPQAAPVDTYVPVQNPKGAGDAFFQVASALKGFSPVLGQFVDRRMDEARTAEEARAEGKIGGMTPQQQAEFIKSGEIDRWEGPWARARFMQLYGGNAGQQAGLQLAKQFETGFDPANTDLEQMISTAYQDGISQIGSDPHAQAQFSRSFSSIADRVRAQGTQAKAQDFKVKAFDQVSQTMVGQIGSMAGKSPSEIFAALRATQKANAETGLMTMQDGDKVLMDVAKRAAQMGDHALVKEILWNDRGGVGALGNKAENLTTAVQLDEAARGQSFEMNQRAAPASMEGILSAVAQGSATREQIEAGVTSGLYDSSYATRLHLQNDAEKRQAQAQASKLQEKAAVQQASDATRSSALNEAWGMSVAGQGAQLRDKEILGEDGKPATLTVKQQRDDAIEKWRRSQDLRDDLTPAGRAFNDSVSFFAPNGFEDTVLQETLSSAAASVSGVDIQKGLPNLDKALDGYDKWRAVYGRLPLYANRNLLKDDPTRRFYEDVRIGIELRGLTREEAMAVAIRNTGPDARKVVLSEKEHKAIRDAAGDALEGVEGSSGLGRLFGGGTAVTNIQDVRRDIETLAEANMNSAASPALATQAAVDQYVSSHINVNGRSVLANSKAYPTNMGQLLTDQLRKVFDANGGKFRGVDDFEDMGVAPDLGGAVAGRWQVVDPTGLPITLPGHGPLYITQDDIDALQIEQRDAAVKAAADAAIAGQAEAQTIRNTPQRGALRVAPYVPQGE